MSQKDDAEAAATQLAADLKAPQPRRQQSTNAGIVIAPRVRFTILPVSVMATSWVNRLCMSTPT